MINIKLVTFLKQMIKKSILKKLFAELMIPYKLKFSSSENNQNTLLKKIFYN